MSYASESAADRLAAVREAIAKVLNSQEYQTAGGRRNRYAELKHLREMERELQIEVGQQSAGATIGEMTTFP